MSKYEFVAVFNGKLAPADLQKAQKEVSDILGTAIKQTDEMGMQKLAYANSKQSHAYIVSYYLELKPEEVLSLKQKMKFVKGLWKHFFFVMTKNQPFFTYQEIEKIYQDKFAEYFANQTVKL